MTRQAARLRAPHGAHRAARTRCFAAGIFFRGGRCTAGDAKDIVWLKPDGAEMTAEEWNQDFARCLGVYLAGGALTEVDARGRRVIDDDFLVLFNAHHDAVPFTLPHYGHRPWLALVDTARDDGLAPDGAFEPGSVVPAARAARWRC